MAALAELVAVLAGLHAALGLHWFPRSAYVFRALLGGRVAALPASRAWGSDRMALCAGPPLPWSGRFHLVELFPVALSSDGCAACPGFDPNPGGRVPRADRYADWNAARHARVDGRAVRIGDARFVTTGSEALARHVARTLVRLAALAPDERERALRTLVREALDADAARERAAAWQSAARGARWPASLAFVLLFVALPATGFTFGLALTWPLVLLALVALQVWSGIAFARAHRALDPAERGERVLRTLIVSISPAEALRSAEVLGRDALARFHPFAAGAALLERGAFERLAVQILRDARHPTPRALAPADPRAAACEEAWRALVAAELESAAARAGIAPATWTAPPRADADERAYCPRCAQTYLLASGACEPCFGVALEPLPGRSPA